MNGKATTSSLSIAKKRKSVSVVRRVNLSNAVIYFRTKPRQCRHLPHYFISALIADFALPSSFFLSKICSNCVCLEKITISPQYFPNPEPLLGNESNQQDETISLIVTLGIDYAPITARLSTKYTQPPSSLT